MNDYRRPKLEEHLEDTIPPVRHFITEYFFARVTERVLEEIKPENGRKVLDLASGMGIDACLLAKRGFDVIAIEPMARMVGFSIKHHAQNHAYSTHVRAYAEEIPIRSGSVDQVLCKGSLDHFLDPHAALTEIKRVLKPGGLLISAVANYDSLSCILSKAILSIKAFIFGEDKNAARPHHEIPSDHITRFNAQNFRSMIGEYFIIRKEIGIGALWGVPYLNLFFDRIDRKTAEKILKAVYQAAEGIPSIADMCLIVAQKAVLKWS